VTRRVVLVEIGRRSATLTGPRIREAIAVTGARSMPHPTRRHRTGCIQVPLADLDDVLAALEIDGQVVEVIARDGAPVAFGGLLGGVG
jgi:hypothetical protein